MVNLLGTIRPRVGGAWRACNDNGDVPYRSVPKTAHRDCGGIPAEPLVARRECCIRWAPTPLSLLHGGNRTHPLVHRSSAWCIRSERINGFRVALHSNAWGEAARTANHSSNSRLVFGRPSMSIYSQNEGRRALFERRR
jgi:hypothetical protein